MLFSVLAVLDFTSKQYRMSEGDGGLFICVRLLSGSTESITQGYIQTESRTAKGTSH